MKSASRRPLVFSLALSTTLAVGAGMAWMTAAGWVGAIARQVFGARDSHEQLVFSADGQPLIQTRNYSSNTTVMRTVDGQPVEDLDKLDVQYGSGWLMTPESKYLRRARLGNASWQSRVIGYTEPGGAPNFWYLVTDDANPVHGYFEGFDAKTRTKIGYLGLAGFRAEEPPLDERFEIDLKAMATRGFLAGQWGQSGQMPYSYGMVSGQSSMVFMVCMGKLYRVDLRRRDAVQIATDQPVLSIANVSQPVRVPDQRELISKRRIVARLADRLLLLDEDGATFRSMPLPDGTRDRALEVFLTLGDETILIVLADIRHEMTDIDWLNPAGEVARRKSVRIAGGYWEYGEEPIWQVAIGPPSPLVLAWAVFNAPRRAVEFGKFDDYATALTHTLRVGWPWLAGVLALSALLAAFAFRRQSRLGQSHPGIWALLVFLLGPAGMIGYLVHRDWPATARCAKCGATVPRDRMQCAACAAEFALPAPRGVEIFA
jgi:hypothetical protein